MRIRVRLSFHVELLLVFVLKKEMREWIRDWMELDYEMCLILTKLPNR